MIGERDIDRRPAIQIWVFTAFFRGSVELFDPQMLLDPLEEQLHVPAIFVEGGDGEGRKSAMTCQKHQRFWRFRNRESDAPQMFGIVATGVVAIECDGLIADHARRAVGRRRIEAMGVHVRFGAGDEEGSGQMQPMKPAEIDISAIHDIDRASFGSRRSSAWTSWSCHPIHG